MADLTRFKDAVWESFFDFAFGCDCSEQPTRKEIQEDLNKFGINVRGAVSKVLEAVAVARARAELTEARAKRPVFLSKVCSSIAPSGKVLREDLRTLIKTRFEGKAQATYFSKLESAATDADLRSLLEDMRLLESFPEGPGDDSGTK
jgi:hypothetical protein